MCGIAGVIDIDSEHRSHPATLDRMVASMISRGPDDGGTLIRPPVALGMRLLSVIDLKTGRQPISNEDDTIHVVMNGELYSHPALRDELIAGGHRFRTRSDTEVLVHGYESWGIEGLLHRLNGMFAFALYDERRGAVYIARDRLGIKPLVYTTHRRVVYFASTIAALVDSGEIPVAPDAAAIRLYLERQFVPEPSTMLDGVRKLPAGSYICVAGGRVSEPKRYWSIPDPVHESRHDEQWRDDLAALLDDVTRTQMLAADVGVGLFLSGGIDSSILLGLMARHCDRPVDAFTIGFGETGFDETPFAHLAAARFGATLHHTEFSAAQFAGIAPDAIATLNEPVGDPACIPLFALSRLAQRRVKVVLSGEGADELFSGYGYYRRIASRSGRAMDQLKRSIGHAAPCAASGYPYVMSVARARSLTPALGDTPRSLLASRNGHAHRNGRSDALNDAARVDIGGVLLDNLLAKVDSTTMAHGLEARVPFLDHRVVEMALVMPGRLKRRGHLGKIIVREAFADLIGEKLAGREKHGFSLPLATWFRGPLRPMIEDSLNDVSVTPWLDQHAVSRLVAEHQRGRDHARALWAMFVLTEWHRALGVRAAAADSFK